MVFEVGHGACDHRGGKIQHPGSPCKAAFRDDLGEYAKGAKLIHPIILPHSLGTGTQRTHRRERMLRSQLAAKVVGYGRLPCKLALQTGVRAATMNDNYLSATILLILITDLFGNLGPSARI